MKRKIMDFGKLVAEVKRLRDQGKTVVHSHGVFDVIHPGLVQHLTDSKEQGDVLAITVIRDKDVRRGPGRPLFAAEYRATNVAALHPADLVAVVDDDPPYQCVKKLHANLFAKGKAYGESDLKIHERIFGRDREQYFGDIKIHETDGFFFSSSQIARDLLKLFPDQTNSFLTEFAKRYDFNHIADQINRLKSMKVLLIGDGIIDEYHHCQSMERSSKAPLVVHKYIEHEVFAGGAFAIANHLSGICDNVRLVTLLGKDNSREEFIREHLRSNVQPHFFYRSDGPTIVKKRYLNMHNNQKMFEVNYLNDEYIDEDCEASILEYINTVDKQYDLVLVSDFGHGLITKAIIQAVRARGGVLGVNSQTNSANKGFNLITKYHRPDFVCLDEPEARLATQERFTEMGEVAAKLAAEVGTQCLIVTLGKNGSIAIGDNGEENRTPIFSANVVDTVGAGDAFFAFTAPCFAAAMPLDLISFIGNVVGALAVRIVGNRRPVEKHEVLEFVHNLLH
ncbi:MAG TPA: hypothetical protein ENH80_13520 [Phycisphaerae bacterium]|nr:hypothetical protein [Phycisphaerae bacterium]HDZ44947.1 hypothetical protein [Phycisphaerae bacterium]